MKTMKLGGRIAVVGLSIVVAGTVFAQDGAKTPSTVTTGSTGSTQQQTSASESESDGNTGSSTQFSKEEQLKQAESYISRMESAMRAATAFARKSA